MGLIKRSQIEEKGEITLKEKLPQISSVVEPAFPEPYQKFEAFEPSEAEIKASEILQAAKANAEAVREKAYAEGVSRGQEQADEKIKEALKLLNDAVLERKKIIKDAEGEILRLSLKAAEQIIRSEVSLHRDVCLNIVSDAINRVSDREQIIVRVNREDAEYIKRYKDRLAGIIDGVKSFSILEDSQIEPGGCVIETNLGYVDARISTKLHAIEDALKKASQEGEHL